jgi:hypothetical protein
LYLKPDLLVVSDWIKLSDKAEKETFKSLTIPVSIGVPILGVLRPHVGLIFKVPFGVGTIPNNEKLSTLYNKKLNGYLVGVGVDLSSILIDLDFESTISFVSRKSIHTLLVDSDEKYRPKKWSLRVGYNLLGLIG